MSKYLLILFLLGIDHGSFARQARAVLAGRVLDGATGGPLAGASVIIASLQVRAVSDDDGKFEFKDVPAGNTELQVSYVGYGPRQLVVNHIADQGSVLEIILLPLNEAAGNAVVTASFRLQKITRTPATVRVIGSKELKAFPGSNVNELLAQAQGLDFYRYGVDGVFVNARGLPGVGNYKILQLIDGRRVNSALSNALPVMNNMTVNKEDVERIELLLGPQGALYGPNSYNTVYNIITKDPRRHQGTDIGISAGSQDQFSTRFRHASALGRKWAIKLVGEYATGREFTFYDSVYAVRPGHPRDTVAIPERNPDFDFKHVRGEVHVYYNMTSKMRLVASAGTGTNYFLSVAGGGRNQARGIMPAFLQARLEHPRFFATVYNTWSKLGETFALSTYTREYWTRTNIPPPGRPWPPDSAHAMAMSISRFREEGQRLNAEAQYNHAFKDWGLRLVAGLHYQKESPNSFGTSLVDETQRIHVTQAGMVLQAEQKLPWQLSVAGAVRFDNHSSYGNYTSPNLALVCTIGDGTARITWGRAYAMPTVVSQFGRGTNLNYGNGKGITYIPNGTYLPNGGQNIDARVYSYTSSLKPEQLSTVEAGYKGLIAQRLFVDVNGYYGKSKNFITPFIQVPGRAIMVGDIPVTSSNPGIITNDTLKGARFFTNFNYGKVDAFGFDAALNYAINDHITVGIKYSWFDTDRMESGLNADANGNGFVSVDETSVNAPEHKVYGNLGLQNLFKSTFSVNINLRYVSGYDFYGNNQVAAADGAGKRGSVIIGPAEGWSARNFNHGQLGGFTTIDINTGYTFKNNITLSAAVTNLFNVEQREFPGSPSIGRLFMAEMKFHVPNSTGKQKTGN